MSTYTQDITHLIGKINTNLPDNDTQAITAARIRDAMGAVAYNYDLYVLKSQLNQELGSYVSQDDLQSALEPYVLKTDLDTAGYVTASQLEGLVTDQELQEGMQSVHDDAYAYVVDKISDIPVIDPSLYVSKTELSEMGYITENDLPDMSTYVSQDDLQSALEPYVTESQLQEAGYATKTYVADYVSEHAPMPDLSAYVTKSQLSQELGSYVTKTELSEAGYLTAVPSEYVTESQLQSTLTAYVTDTELSSMGYITSSALGDYVTETELSQAGYLTSIPSEYVTQSQLSANSYVTETNMLQAMEYYASSYYVSKEALSQASYVTQNELSNMGYVTQTDLSAMSYATTSDLSNKQDTLVSGTNIKTINGETLLGDGDITIQSGAEPDYSHVLKFTADQANSTIKMNRVGTDTSLANAMLQYSTDNGASWTDYTLGTSITLTAIGDSVMFKGINTTLAYDYNNYHRFIMTGKISASGDITSLFNETGGDIPMPAYGCYYLFYRCTSLTTAPKLPSTTLANYCYNEMFRDCTSLTDAPELPATTLADSCYSGMFFGCTYLTKAPKLPATTLTQTCYGSMFEGCTRLTTPPELPATTLATACYSGMFWGCTSLTDAPELPATTLATQCYQNMFNTCTSLTKAPDLPATSLSVNCYSGMFYKCSSLKYIKAMFTSSPALYQTQDWVYNVSSTGTFIKSSSATWTTTGTNGVPSGWTVYKTVAIDTDDVPESYVEDNGKGLQVVNGAWQKVSGLLTSANLIYDSTTNTLTINV